MGRDPEQGGALRGAVLIVAVGVALGVAYNAMGLAGRPAKGLAWIKTTPKVESLESVLAEPAATTVTASSGEPAPPGTIDAGPGAANAAEPPQAPMPAVRGGNAAVPTSASSAPAKKKGADESKSADQAADKAAPNPAAPDAKSGGAPAANAGTPAQSAAAPGTAPIAAPSSPPPPAPANLPVIPDVPGPLKLELATLKKLYDANAVLVIDAREAPEYAEGHIKGALSLPYNDAMAEPEKVQKLDPAGRPIVIYCSGGECELSRDLARVLIEAGKRRVLIYEAGFPEWQGAGLPVTRGATP